MEKEFSSEEFNAKVRELAERDGVTALLDVPNVWESVAEHYNNDALRELKEEHETTTPDECGSCGESSGFEYYGGAWICDECQFANAPKVFADDAELYPPDTSFTREQVVEECVAALRVDDRGGSGVVIGKIHHMLIAGELRYDSDADLFYYTGRS